MLKITRIFFIKKCGFLGNTAYLNKLYRMRKNSTIKPKDLAKGKNKKSLF